MRYLLILIAAICLADEAKAPTITTEHRAKYWRAQVNLIKAQVESDTAIKDMQVDCGEAQVVSGRDGEPICGPKPESPKAVPGSNGPKVPQGGPAIPQPVK